MAKIKIEKSIDLGEKFYVTTPIYYINDKPHIGHALTNIVADAVARWRRSQGDDVLFLTGTDENSQKTVDAAKKSGEEIVAYTDRLAGIWESTWTELGISNTDFIRTTEKRHIDTVRDLWERRDLGTVEAGYQATVPAHGVVMLKVIGE